MILWVGPCVLKDKKQKEAGQQRSRKKYPFVASRLAQFAVNKYLRKKAKEKKEKEPCWSYLQTITVHLLTAYQGVYILTKAPNPVPSSPS